MQAEYDFSGGQRGAVVPQTNKTRITIDLDNDILDELRDRSDATGQGYQTMINQALREFLGKSNAPIDEPTLRRILQEELRATR
jgi:uncharacterized protein (DUF4415 family)